MLKLILLSFLLIQAVNLTDISYYEILGISKQASTQEIRQAYKKLAIKFHPDKNPDATEQEKFIKITEAYETLKDPDKRYKYDMYGSYPSYTRKYDYKSQAEYNNLYYNGLYHEDPFVDTLSPASYYNYLQNGFHFINFYSPFCPPCQNLADHWKRLAEVYKGIVKIGAVNCKYYNSFCYNSMRIGSYPSLLFFPNGKHGNFIYYRGDRTYEALDKFVMTYLESQVYVPTLSKIRNSDKPIAYVLGSNRLEKDALTRIGYHLNGLVNLAIVEDDALRAELTKNEYTTVVFKYKDITKEIDSSEEMEVLKQIVAALPRIEMIEPEKLKKIRTKLRNDESTPWVLYLSSQGHDRLLLHQMRIANTDLNFGEIDCDKWIELCLSLQADEPPAWAVLKAGGAYQLVPPSVDVRSYIHTAAAAKNLHSLSASDLQTIIDGELGMWVLLVVPYKLPWDKFVDPITKASLHYKNSDVSFGIMCCSLSSDKLCRQLAPHQAAIAIVTGTKGQRYTYTGELSDQALLEYIELLRDTKDIELTEDQVLAIMDSSTREQSWLVAFFPANCGQLCDLLMQQWRIVAKKLRPLPWVRVGAVVCGHTAAPAARGLCDNVRAPTARLYPYAAAQHYSANLQHLTEAPYILEWALEHLDDSITKLSWHMFSRKVAAEELNPGPGQKPWLVYFHSPRCYACYQKYADFAVAGILLRNAVHLGKVNCISERNLCQQEQINTYPSLKLYLNRNQYHRVSTVVHLRITDYASLLRDIKAHIRKYDESLLAGIDDAGVKNQGFRIKHDEF